MEKKVELIVRIILKDETGKILFAKREKSPAKGRWSLPGGKVEFKESALSAARREIEEELSISINPEFLFFIEDFDSIEDKHVIVFCFSAVCKQSDKNNIVIKTDEIQEIDFFSAVEIENRDDIAFNHKDIIKKYRETQ
ncbi:MAG: NUDIX hydrolase [Candidatus Aenigmarchaeota archaeon]|nr:NUDIX hydrolase [Candidatus Aenigmarchaeota archaeon]